MSLEAIIERLDKLHKGQENLQGGLEKLEKRQAALETGQEDLRNGQEGLKNGQEGLKNGQEGLKNGQEGLKILLEQTRDIAKLGLEANQGLRESMERRFNETEKKYDEQIELLKVVLKSRN